MIIWEDSTSYSQGERGKAEPRAWRTKINRMDVLIHRIHGIHGWYLTSRYLDIKDFGLVECDIEQCKERTIEIVKKALYSKIQDMQDILVNISESAQR